LEAESFVEVFLDEIEKNEGKDGSQVTGKTELLNTVNWGNKERFWG